jgi:hypothetical protein
VRRDHVEPFAGAQPGGHLGVERRVVGVNDDLHVGRVGRVEQPIQVVVHRPTDEGDPQRHAGLTIR